MGYRGICRYIKYQAGILPSWCLFGILVFEMNNEFDEIIFRLIGLNIYDSHTICNQPNPISMIFHTLYVTTSACYVVSLVMLLVFNSFHFILS